MHSSLDMNRWARKLPLLHGWRWERRLRNFDSHAEIFEGELAARPQFLPRPHRPRANAMTETSADGDGIRALDVLELQAGEARVEAAGGGELLVRSFLDDAARL